MRKFFRIVLWLWVGVFLLSGSISLDIWISHPRHANMTFPYIFGWCIIGPIVLLMVVGVWCIFASTNRLVNNGIKELSVAEKPIPTPAEIAAQLQAEWGRPASVQEVAAIHQMLTSRKHEAMLNAGVSLGAAYLMVRTAQDLSQGKKVL